jgi:hypothetical protein
MIKIKQNTVKPLPAGSWWLQTWSSEDYSIPSTRDGTSLFVTTKQAGIIAFKSISKGSVIEIPDIEQKIEASKRG